MLVLRQLRQQYLNHRSDSTYLRGLRIDTQPEHSALYAQWLQHLLSLTRRRTVTHDQLQHIADYHSLHPNTGLPHNSPWTDSNGLQHLSLWTDTATMHCIEFDFLLTHWSPAVPGDDEGYCFIKYTNYLNRQPPGSNEASIAQLQRVIEVDNNFSFGSSHYFLWPEGYSSRRLQVLEDLLNRLSAKIQAYLQPITTNTIQMTALHQICNNSIVIIHEPPSLSSTVPTITLSSQDVSDNNNRIPFSKVSQQALPTVEASKPSRTVIDLTDEPPQPSSLPVSGKNINVNLLQQSQLLTNQHPHTISHQHAAEQSISVTAPECLLPTAYTSPNSTSLTLINNRKRQLAPPQRHVMNSHSQTIPLFSASLNELIVSTKAKSKKRPISATMLHTPVSTSNPCSLTTFASANITTDSVISHQHTNRLLPDVSDELLSQPSLAHSSASTVEFFPSPSVINQHRHLLHFLEVCQSSFGAGNSVRTTCTRKKNDIIGLYSGPIVSAHLKSTNDDTYLMSFRFGKTTVCIDGTPPTHPPFTDFTICSLANEYIWDHSFTNAAVQSDGRIRAIQTIPKGHEIFIEYGNEYNWNCYFIAALIPNFCVQLQRAAVYLHATAAQHSIDVITTLVTSWKTSALFKQALASINPLHRLLSSVIAGRLPMGDTHDKQPLYSTYPSFLSWLERLLTCKLFYAHVAFRFALNPQSSNTLHLLQIANVNKSQKKRIVTLTYPDICGMPVRPQLVYNDLKETYEDVVAVLASDTGGWSSTLPIGCLGITSPTLSHTRLHQPLLHPSLSYSQRSH